MAASNQNKSHEDIIRGLTEFKGDYLPLDKDRLVLFAVSLLESKKIEPTFDKIVVVAFKLFPKKFSLIGFPEYPDGRTIYYCVFNHCTLSKKWLSGNVQSGFKVTEKGKYFLDETKKMLEGKIKITKTHGTIPKRKEVRFINILKSTAAFKKYLQGRKEEITDYEISEALKAPPNSEELMHGHLKKYLEYASRIGETPVIEFLEFIKRKLKGGENA